MTCEKADLESFGKERGELNLPLTSASTLATTSSTSTSVGNNSEISGHTTSPCKYRAEIIKFKRTMVLPGSYCVNKRHSLIFMFLLADEYFLPEEPVCHCLNCYKLKNNDEAFKDESLISK